MKKIIIYIILSFFSALVFAQQPGSKDKIEAAKIGFISEKLNLNPKQAQLFWPVYGEYAGKRKEIRKAIKQLKLEGDESQTDAEALEDLRKIILYKQKELDLEKEYLDKFLKILSANQVALLYKAEKEFSQMLLDKLKNNK